MLKNIKYFLMLIKLFWFDKKTTIHLFGLEENSTFTCSYLIDINTCWDLHYSFKVITENQSWKGYEMGLHRVPVILHFCYSLQLLFWSHQTCLPCVRYSIVNHILYWPCSNMFLHGDVLHMLWQKDELQ